MKETKKQVLDNLQEIQKKWQNENKKGILSRSYYREHGKYKTEIIDKLFGSFTEAKRLCKFKEKNKITRTSFNIIKSNKLVNKRYFVTAIIPGAKINKKFWESILTYCKHNNAEPLLLVMRGVTSDAEFTKEILDEFEKYFITEFNFNSNLIAKDFILSPQQILPLTGLSRYGGKHQSIIVAHSKQMFITIPKQHDKSPHIVVSTGTICEPTYNNTRQGQIAKEDNCLGGLIVEVKDDKIFYLRVIRFDGTGFQDLNKYYNQNKIIDKNVHAIIAEPHFGVEDPMAMGFFNKLINLYKPNSIFFHDSFDGSSVNPHNRNRIGIRCTNDYTLSEELNYLHNSLFTLELNHPKLKFFHVYSNHNYFVDRYLQDGEFIKDQTNVKLGAELFLAMLRDEDPIEYYIGSRGLKLKNQTFLKMGQSYSYKDVELNTHGHSGSNGGRGNIKNIEVSHSNAIIGHFHSPTIWRDVFQIPCLCKLQQKYNKDGTSSWLQGVCLLFENGQKQIILSINGEWKL
jgi:hypothetical protein